jgi:hypothetical protein
LDRLRVLLRRRRGGALRGLGLLSLLDLLGSLLLSRAGCLLGLCGGELGLLKLLASLSVRLLGLCKLLLNLHQLLLGLVLTLAQRALKLTDSSLHPRVVFACGSQLSGVRAAAPAGAGRTTSTDRRSAIRMRFELVVLFQESRQLDLDDVEEGIDFFFVVPTLADRRFLECDVMNFGGCQRHSVTSVFAGTEPGVPAPYVFGLSFVFVFVFVLSCG